MTDASIQMRRPERWQEPLDPDMSKADVDWLLTQPPFCNLNPDVFPKATPLRGILQHECRIRLLEPGEVVVREGDYGNSAFLVLSGTLSAILSGVSEAVLGREQPSKRSWLSAAGQALRRARYPESRDEHQVRAPHGSAVQQSATGASLFLQDFAGVLNRARTITVGPHEMFGEVSAMYRTPRTATVVATAQAAVLEIRWQGLRSLHRDPQLGRMLDENYRRNWLHLHLRETNLLRFLPEAELDAVTRTVQMCSFGRMEWHKDYLRAKQLPPAAQIEAEPLVAAEGHVATELILIRSGFARVCRRYGKGWQTIAYLGKGQLFGLREIAHNWRTGEGQPQIVLQESLRAIGFLDTLHIPIEAVIDHILPHVRSDELPDPIVSDARNQNSQSKSAMESIPTSMLEFLVQHRLNNGRHAMVIDLNRCIRCDDCVRACATTHDGNPRFVRGGPTHGGLQFTQSCMHCADPVCMIGCPTGAIARSVSDGTVTIHEGICIGCGTCAASCPYENIRMTEVVSRSGLPIIDQRTERPIEKATKCDLCQEQPSGPACQNACPHEALTRLDLTDLEAVGHWVREHSDRVSRES